MQQSSSVKHLIRVHQPNPGRRHTMCRAVTRSTVHNMFDGTFCRLLFGLASVIPSNVFKRVHGPPYGQKQACVGLVGLQQASTAS